MTRLLLVVLAVLSVAAAGNARAAAVHDGDAGGAGVDLGRYAGPLSFQAAPDGAVDLGGRRYAGTVEVHRTGDGMRLVNEVGMQRYVEGIGEMPARWPMEALKAQAVAARTYAWNQMGQGGGSLYDICDSTACQVYRGRDVVETPEVGQRWAAAVAATAGEVLLHDGEPILARYFSTSGGHTFDNEDVFASEGPRPYLKGVPDPDDAVSPLHRWEARFTRAQFDAILAEGRTLSAAVPLARLERLERPGGEPDVIRAIGEDGTAVEVTAVPFRRFVSDVAPDLFPERYPGPRADGGTLPTAVPSSRFEPIVTEDEVVLEGSGWGHGVGMGQYGAKGKADRGLTYDEILAAYYGGLRPQAVPGVPETVRVGLSVDAAEHTITSEKPFVVRAGDVEITDRGLGTWQVDRASDGSLRLRAPEGYGAPLVVAPTAVNRARPTVLEVLRLETTVNKASELALEITGPSGAVQRRELGIVEAGVHTARWSLDGPDGGTVPAGSYRVRLVATDEDAATAGTAASVEVAAPQPPPEPAPSLLPPVPATGPGRLPFAVATVLGAAAGVLLGRRIAPRPAPVGTGEVDRVGA